MNILRIFNDRNILPNNYPHYVFPWSCQVAIFEQYRWNRASASPKALLDIGINAWKLLWTHLISQSKRQCAGSEHRLTLCKNQDMDLVHILISYTVAKYLKTLKSTNHFYPTWHVDNWPGRIHCQCFTGKNLVTA